MTKYRSIWISDVHLGTKHSEVGALLEFLKENDCDNLYIVGDFIDGWALRKKWFWDENHNILIQKILRKARKGTRIVYITGNHDEFLRLFGEVNFGNILITDEIIHESSNGKKYLVIHGDIFDGILNSASFISKLGSTIYDYLITINKWFNFVRRRLGYGYWSLSHQIKVNTKKALQYINKFEQVLAAEAKKQKVNGVICGHIHNPLQSIIDGIEYNNCGCWVEMGTALVETEDGEIKLIKIL